jgi:hypothetical protein
LVRPPARLLALLLLVLAIDSRGGPSGPASPTTDRLAAALRALYTPAQGEWERYRRGRSVTLPYRDDPDFLGAAALLLGSREADDGPLGAWLLGTLPATTTPERARAAAALLAPALEASDSRVAFEAARSLARVGGHESLAALERAAHTAASTEVRAASGWSAERVAARAGIDPPPRAVFQSRLPAGFHRGVCWWMSERRDDDGTASFRELASLGVDWVSIHTWDPLQRGIADPELAPRSERFGLRGLPALVQSAHAAGLKVMVKPHLEMRWHGGEPGEWHGLIAMRSEADWTRWFAQYEAYVLGYAVLAEEAHADLFCVGRELDRTVIARPQDWRRLIARVRAAFHGPLVYSANFDTYADIGFWDALDYIGISAYFPLAAKADPDPEALQRGWDGALTGIEAVSRRFGRSVLFTEVGYPATAEAPRAPATEGNGPADVWLQARCYDAALRAVATRPFIAGTYFWLWEGTRQPPFRDASYAIAGKPAAFTMASWYRGLL